MLEKLTPEQEKLMIEIREKWLNKCFSLEFDEKKAITLINWVYEDFLKLKKPLIIILDNPLQCQFLINFMVFSLKDQIITSVWDEIQLQIHKQILDRPGKQILDNVQNPVLNKVQEQIQAKVWKLIVRQIPDQFGLHVRNHFLHEVQDQILDQVWGQIGDQLLLTLPLKQIRYHVWDQVAAQVRDQVLDKVLTQIQDKVSVQLRDQIENQIWFSIVRQIRNQIQDNVSTQIQKLIQVQTENALWFSIIKQIRKQIWNNVSVQVQDQVMNKFYTNIYKHIKNEIQNQIQTIGPIFKEIWDQVSKQFSSQIENQVNIQVSNKITNPVWSNVSNKIMNQIYAPIYKQVGEKIWDQVQNHVKKQVFEHLWNKIEHRVWNQYNNETRNKVMSYIEEHKKQKIEYFYDSLRLTIYDYFWCAFYDFFTEIGIVNHKKFNRYKNLIDCNIFYCVLFKNIVFISRPPKYIKRNDSNRLHSTEGYAIYFKNWGLYYLNGRNFTEKEFYKYIKNEPSPKEILGIKNIEKRAEIIKYWGFEKIFDELSLQCISKYKSNGDTHYLFECSDLPINLLKVIDTSTKKPYILGVPENLCNCLEAIAWTFGVSKEEYLERIES